MNFSDIYESTISELLDALKEDVSQFTTSFDITYGEMNVKPLFAVTSHQKDLIRIVSHFSDNKIRKCIANLCFQISECLGYNPKIISGIDNIDYSYILNGQTIGYIFSLSEDYLPSVENAKTFGIDKFVIVVLKNKISKLKPNTLKYKLYQDKALIENISLEEYFERICPGEFLNFKEYIGKFNYEAEQILGLTISPMPTKKALLNKQAKITEELESCFFEDYLLNFFSKEEIHILKKRLFAVQINKLYNKDFMKSFVSSEWYFDLRKSEDGEMEQTAIVAGYLKSIEQFLFSAMLSRCDTLIFSLFNKKSKKYDKLSKENQKDLLTMAGNLVKSIDYNYGKELDQVYLNGDIGKKVNNILESYFAHTRNGYFHKDNIYNFEEIIRIRKESFAMLFLICSAFRISWDQL